jgi:hypothetical protein
MNPKFSKTLTLTGTIAALAFPALAVAKSNHGNGKGNSHGQEQAQLHAHSHGQGKAGAQGQSKPRNYIVKGTVTGVAGDVVTVDVGHANHHGAGLVGQTVQFDLSEGRVVGRAHDTSDVKTGDRVVVQARLPRDLTGTQQPYKARRLVDRGPKPVSQQAQSTTGGDDQKDS